MHGQNHIKLVLHHIAPSLTLHRLTARSSALRIIHNVVPLLHNPTPHRLYTVKRRGKAQKFPSHAAHHVPWTPTTTPDEDIISHITDPLLERTDSLRTGSHCQKQKNRHSSQPHHRTLGNRHAGPPRTLVHQYIISDYLICTYTGCPRRNGQNFGRVFFMLKYTDINQNTYIQS